LGGNHLGVDLVDHDHVGGVPHIDRTARVRVENPSDRTADDRWTPGAYLFADQVQTGAGDLLGQAVRDHLREPHRRQPDRVGELDPVIGVTTVTTGFVQWPPPTPTTAQP
jgi:hypothetical protein